MERYDAKINLWETSEGKHNIRGTPLNLLMAAEMDVLNDFPVERIFRALRDVQDKDGQKRGNFWWVYEDGEARGNSSAFFTVHPSLVLHQE